MQLRSLFMLADQDNSGHLEANEVKKLIKSVTDRDVTDLEIDRFIALCDEDGDGRISFEEFLQFMLD